VVTRFRIALENCGLAAGSINGRLAAVRRLAYEAADAGLLSPELAAGIRRGEGVKKLGVTLGNWLTAEEARRLWQAPDANTLKGKRDRGDSRSAAWLRVAKRGVGGSGLYTSAAARGTLGDCRSGR
jgi:integrase